MFSMPPATEQTSDHPHKSRVMVGLGIAVDLTNEPNHHLESNVQYRAEEPYINAIAPIEFSNYKAFNISTAFVMDPA